jgi:hypothetical protein
MVSKSSQPISNINLNSLSEYSENVWLDHLLKKHKKNMKKRNFTCRFVWYENLSLTLREQHEFRDKVMLGDVTAGSLVGSDKHFHLSTTPIIVKIRWRSWLRHCGTNSIPDGVIGIFR